MHRLQELAESHAESLIAGTWQPGEDAVHYAYRMSVSQIAIAAYRNIASLPHEIIALSEESKDKQEET